MNAARKREEAVKWGGPSVQNKGLVMQTEQSARAEAGAMAETMKDETKNVAREVQQQARTALHQVQDDLRSRADTEATRFAETLHATGQQLSSMADAATDQGLMPTIVRDGAQAVERLAGRLDQGGLDAITGDIRRWARRSPGSFLLGAGALGFLAGRLARNLSGNGGASATSGTASEQPSVSEGGTQ
jgi:hypothetical protein